METLIATPTKCKLCERVFPSDFLRDAVILGANPQAKLQQVDALMKPLLKHLQKHHPEAIEQAQFAGSTFAGYLMVNNFEIDEETRAKLGSDLTRWKIRQMMTRQETRISDERLDERLTAVLDQVSIGTVERGGVVALIRSQLHDELLTLLKQLRDALEERNRYVEGPPLVQQA